MQSQAGPPHGGIMTLTRAPCDLDTMSLFQDLKLKRRKVDSRCSSDGESVADTSTSSPDVAAPNSPCKMDQQPHSPIHINRSVSPDCRLPGAISGPQELSSTPTSETITEIPLCSNQSQVIKQGDTWDNEGSCKTREIWDTGGPSIRYARSASSESRIQVCGKPPGMLQIADVTNIELKRNNSKTNDQWESDEAIKQEEMWEHQCQTQNNLQSTTSNVSTSQESENKWIDNSEPLSWSRINGLPSEIMDSPKRKSLLNERTHQRPDWEDNTKSQSSQSVNAEKEDFASDSKIKWEGVSSWCRTNGVRPELIISPKRNSSPKEGTSCQTQQQSPMDWDRGESCRPSSQLTIDRPDTSPDTSRIKWEGSNNQQSNWSGRINGVRPELIGGGRGINKPAPTVVMGEIGGVRTMVWSQPEPPWTPSPAPPPIQEETAAQLLLTLGGQQIPSPEISSGSAGSGNSSITSGSNSGGGTDGNGEPKTGAKQLNMEKLWAGDLSQLPAAQQMTALNLSPSGGNGNSGNNTTFNPEATQIVNNMWNKYCHTKEEQEEEEQPMICMICEDKATGLHYGIITCEGCKGFFKRTVQNRRVYTCVANGTCEITKAQRNRCQYCRFKKCIEQGMVLQAVREDRMPGGRNSGAVYNLYKVKYKKHKKTIRNGQVKPETKTKPVTNQESGIPSHLVNGTILKTALTNPSEVVHLRQRLDNTVSSSRDRMSLNIDTALSMIQNLIDCDEFQDIATLRNLDELLEHKADLSDKLMQIGDSIVYKLVQWTKRLPFYLELPVEVHTRLLTHKWHELLVLTTSAYQAIHGINKSPNSSTDGTAAHFSQEVANNLCILQTCLTSMMGRAITMDQLQQDVGLMVERITYVTLMFRRIKLTMQEYVCLKVIIMLNPARGGTTELESIQERYMTCLKTYVEFTSPNQPTRFHDLLCRLPEVQSAASLLLESKMFYVPFLLNSAIQR